MHPNHKKHVSKYRQRMAENGYRRLPDYWIPNTPEAIARVKELVERECEKFERDKL